MTAAPSGDTAELADLLRVSASGDRAAFAALYRRTSSKLFGVCLRMLHERGEAEDALQNVYITVWRRAGSFDPARAAGMTWLITLARNHCIDRLRKRREVPLDDGVAENLTAPDPDPPAQTEASEQRRRLEHCLEGLGTRQKSAVCAAFYSGATYNELATRESVPLATMKSWIRRSLIHLRTCLEQST